MLIIAIPKSASTSLATSLCELHGLTNETATINQMFKHARPDGVRFLHTYHALPVIDEELVQTVYADNSTLYKLHVFPTDQSLQNLAGRPKVVLLREPEEIVMAEKRAIESLIHRPYHEFADCRTEEEWMERAKEIGLYEDLRNFYDRWKAAEGDDTLIVHYHDLVNDPQSVVNAVERFLRWPVSPDVKLKKERYSGASRAKVILQRSKRLYKKIRRRAGRVLRRAGLRH